MHITPIILQHDVYVCVLVTHDHGFTLFIQQITGQITQPALQRRCMSACCSSSIINPTSPSMHFIELEAMWTSVTPARTCVTLVPKYRWRRWLIRLKQCATGNTVKNKKRRNPVPEIQGYSSSEMVKLTTGQRDERLSK